MARVFEPLGVTGMDFNFNLRATHGMQRLKANWR